MDKTQALTIIQHAVEKTKPRWLKYDESWNNINDIFIYRGYEQQGFQLYKLRPVIEKLNIFSIDILGGIFLNYPNKTGYRKELAGSLSTEFYINLQKGVCGHDGELFVKAVRTFLDEKLGNPGMTFWKLLYQMLQGCAYLKQNYSSSFGKYILSKYASFINVREISEHDFLNITVTEWEYFLAKTKPWKNIMGIGPNVFDFLFGDIVEAQFVKNSYKFDSSNQHFLQVTGISKLITPFDRVTTTRFLKSLDIPFSLRQINKGIYTYCSKSESENYGYCRDLSKCRECKVNSICEKEIRHFEQPKTRILGSSKPNNTLTLTQRKSKPSQGLPQLYDATTFEELSEIIRIRSGVYPTNYLDLLFLENSSKKLSEILYVYQHYEGKNNDYKTVPRMKVHIRYREIHDGWIFRTSGDPNNPVVKLIGLK